MKRIDERCGVELCTYEYDHVREHSIELHAILLRHVLPKSTFSIASYLCPDPCGPTDTAPRDGHGVDLKKFAEALRDEIAADCVPTCIIASADLSHVGRFFQDESELCDEYLQRIAQSDQKALSFVAASDPEAFRSCVAATSNQTNICSVGCIYALATALRDIAKPEMLYYHQAHIRDLENCVSSTAAVYWA
jgi:AmmeMemoRadiSam system protein B